MIIASICKLWVKLDDKFTPFTIDDIIKYIYTEPEYLVRPERPITELIPRPKPRPVLIPKPTPPIARPRTRPTTAITRPTTAKTRPTTAITRPSQVSSSNTAPIPYYVPPDDDYMLSAYT